MTPGWLIGLFSWMKMLYVSAWSHSDVLNPSSHMVGLDSLLLSFNNLEKGKGAFGILFFFPLFHWSHFGVIKPDLETMLDGCCRPQTTTGNCMSLLEKEMALHSSSLAWRIPWTEEPGGLQSMGSHRVRHNWSNFAHTLARMSLYCVQMDIWYFEAMCAWKVTELWAVTSVISAKYQFLLFHVKYMHLIAYQLLISQGYMTWKIFYTEGGCLSLHPRESSLEMEPRSPTLQADSLPAEPQGKPKNTGVGSLSLLRRILLTQE